MLCSSSRKREHGLAGFRVSAKEDLNKQLSIVRVMGGSSVNHRRPLDSSRFGAKCHWGVCGGDEISCGMFAAPYARCQRKRCRRAINRLASIGWGIDLSASAL